MDDQIRIPGYRIIRELGSGGMATVYLAVQEKLNRDVAVKVLSPALLADKQFAARFLKEAELAAKLHHSNIIPIYDVGQEGFSHYILMEYLESSLKDKIKEGPVEPAGGLSIVKQIVSALSYAHSRGFIHRDIKPENIMFRADGTAVLTDFGIAKAMGSATKLTKTGMSIGTPHYMSPEQARGKELDGRADIYSLGVVFYEMLTGNVPYDAEDSVAVAIMHIQEPIPKLPPHLKTYQPLLDRMMAKDRDVRARSGEEVIGMIDEMGAGTVPPSARRPTPAQGTRTRPSEQGTPHKPAPPLEPPHLRDWKLRVGSEDGRPSRILLAGLAGALAIAVVLLFVVLSRKPEKVAQQVPSPSPAPAMRSEPAGGAATRPAIPPPMIEDQSAKKKQEYDKYFSKAKTAFVSGDYALAKTYALQAKGQEATYDVGALEERINSKIAEQRQAAEEAEKARKEAAASKQAEQQQRKSAEEAAWSLASQANTQESYQEYLDVFPSGDHATEAAAKKTELAGQEGRAEELRTAQPASGRVWVKPKSGIEFVWVPPGRFKMGSNSAEAFSGEQPIHDVELDGFWMGKYEVTQGQWVKVMGSNSSSFKKGDNYPVEQVSWEDAQKFIGRLNVGTGITLRLPTEAEWEYACRAGTTGDRYASLDSVAWYSANSGSSTHPVGTKPANAWGLHDMLGNVWEWCQDWYGGYGTGNSKNPTGPSSGSSRVDRGGSWSLDARNVRATYRGFSDPSHRVVDLGFRLARTN